MCNFVQLNLHPLHAEDTLQKIAACGNVDKLERVDTGTEIHAHCILRGGYPAKHFAEIAKELFFPGIKEVIAAGKKAEVVKVTAPRLKA